MVIGIIGLSRRDFTKFCTSNECVRVTEIEYKDSHNNRYICVDKYMNVCGRMFDKIIDLDPVRWDLIHRVANKNDYCIGRIPEVDDEDKM